MKITHHPWRLMRPWRVISDEVYVLNRVSRNGLSPDNPFWCMRNGAAAEWLHNLPPPQFMGRCWHAAKFMYHGPRMPFRLMASGGKLKLYGDPPPIWMARKQDVLLFKLTFGGR